MTSTSTEPTPEIIGQPFGQRDAASMLRSRRPLRAIDEHRWFCPDVIMRPRFPHEGNCFLSKSGLHLRLWRQLYKPGALPNMLAAALVAKWRRGKRAPRAT
jgi:hypothetical protein